MSPRLLITAILLAACAEGELEVDAGPAAACESCPEGAQRCSAEGLEICLKGAPCNQWAPGPPCGFGQVCREGVCAGCTDECVEGAAGCAPEGVTACAPGPSGCLVFGAPSPCEAGTRCDEGRCVPAASPCEDDCAAGARECADGGLRECGQHDDDACLDWSAAFPCPGGACVDGACSAACADECQAGQRCVGDAVQACGDFDGDACLEPGEPQPCAAGERCAEGRCEPAGPSCQDLCALGGSRCEAAGVSRCADQDGDGCTEWSPAIACEGGQRCTDGRCEAACQDACAPGTTRCAGAQVELCDPQPGGCAEWRATIPCGAGEACVNGACVGQQPEQGPVLLEWAVDGDVLLVAWAPIDAPGDYVLRLSIGLGGREVARIDRVGPGQLGRNGARFDGFPIDEVCRAAGAPGEYALAVSVWHQQFPAAADSAQLPVPASCR